MDSDGLDIFDIHGDEFRFLDYPNTFLSDKYNDGDLNKSANTQLEENLNELIKVTNERNPTRPQPNGNGLKTNYLDDLNDLKELKRIEDKKSYQQSLDRLSKLNLATSSNYQSNYTSNFGSSLASNYLSSNQANHLADGRKLTYKFEQNKPLRTFKSNNNLVDERPVDVKVEPVNQFDQTFDLRNYCEENERTFTLNNKLLNLSGQQDDDEVNNTFTIAKNYDEVQEIARKQEAVLKKSKPPNQALLSAGSINNATITKAKKNGLYTNKLDQTVILKHLINENLNDSGLKSSNLGKRAL